MRYRIAVAAAMLGLGGLGVQIGAAQAQAPALHIEHAAATVIITPEARTDISITVSRGDARLAPLSVRKDGGVVVVDGGVDTRHLTCSGGYGLVDSRRVKLPGVGWVAVRDLPVITVHAPRTVAITADGAVWGAVGASDAVAIENVGCGDWHVAAVRGKLDIHVVGSGDLTADTAGALGLSIVGSGDVGLSSVAGPAKIVVAGSGDVHVGSVGGALDVQLRGSGDLFADRVAGTVNAKIAGSGDMKINGGRAAELAVQTLGSGDFVFNGLAGSVSAAVSGSGDIHVAHADGPVGKSVSGSGDIDIGR